MWHRNAFRNFWCALARAGLARLWSLHIYVNPECVSQKNSGCADRKHFRGNYAGFTMENLF